MTVALTMPRLGETVTGGTIIRWLKKEGESVKKDESIVEISTAKIETEIPSPASGTVSKILVGEDETVEVGTELALIEEAGAPAPEEAKPPAPAVEIAAPPAPAEERSAARPVAATAEVGFVSPIVRKLASEHGIDLARVKGTGAGGRITRKDIESYIAAGAPAVKMPKPPIAVAPPISPAPMPPAEIPERELPGRAAVKAERPAEVPAAAPPPVEVRPAPPKEVKLAPAEVPGLPGERIVAMNHLRREIAEHMVKSHQTTAPVTAIVEVDMSNVVRQRERVKNAFKAREGFPITYLAFVAKATIDALINFPTFNARIVDEHHMALHDYINLGIAVAVKDGLIVPVIKHAEEMSLTGLAHQIYELADKTRSGRLSPDDVTGSTFTITNPGSFGSIIQTPIINYPNAAILSLEAIQKRPVVIDDAIAVREMVFMPLTYDHRIVDGALAAQFLNRVKHHLETWDFTPDLATFIE